MGEHSWRMGINDFADMTFEEFKEARLMASQECSGEDTITRRAGFALSR
jgi:hypothetical protein